MDTDDIDNTPAQRHGEIVIELESPCGPRVIETGHVPAEVILEALPAGWTVHPDDWQNPSPAGINRRAYPLSRTA